MRLVAPKWFAPWHQSQELTAFLSIYLYRVSLFIFQIFWISRYIDFRFYAISRKIYRSPCPKLHQNTIKSDTGAQ